MSPVLLLSILAGAVQGTSAPSFHWQKGQVLLYRVEHVTEAAETTSSNKSETKTRLNLTKRWQVLDVNARGIATLQLALASLRLETESDGKRLLFDSAKPQESDKELAEHLGRFVGSPIAVLRVDARGKVVEVKESKHGPASRFETESPLIVVLPGDDLQAGRHWDRRYKITLDPPQGTGEKYDAVQKYECKATDDRTATVTITTVIQSLPKTLLDQVPLLQMQPAGEVVFDKIAGRVQRARLEISKELPGFQGDGSIYQFRSVYTEQYVGD
jgi:hypothetical protein